MFYFQCMRHEGESQIVKCVNKWCKFSNLPNNINTWSNMRLMPSFSNQVKPICSLSEISDTYLK